jgi:hypothetical protein
MKKSKIKSNQKAATKEDLYEIVKLEFEQNGKIHIDNIVKKFKCTRSDALKIIKRLMVKGVLDFGDMLDAIHIIED